jgi:hypothetical protein
MVYINHRSREGYTETVDEAETQREASELVKDYRVSDSGGIYWTSPRPCKEWKEKETQ